MAREMTLFVDDDGKAYHIYSSEENSTTHISLLTDDTFGCRFSSMKTDCRFCNGWMNGTSVFLSNSQR